MKFTCTQENLARGLAIVSRVASKNVALPILNNILITAETDGVSLQATNLEVGVTAKVRGKIDQPGTYTIQARLLAEFITLLGHERVDVELKPDGLHVSSGHTSSTLKGLPAEDFPVLPSTATTTKIEIPGNILSAGLSGVVFAAAADESRPEISGIFLQAKGDELTLAATDSYRLSERRIKALRPSPNEIRIIIPSRAIQELLRIVPQDESVVQIEIGENQLHVQLQDVHFVTRLIEGKYPDYGQIIPKNWQTKITAPTEAFVANVRAASLFCKPGINDITLSVEPDKKAITLSAANTQVGEHRATLEGEISGQSVSAVFNFRYLLDGAASLQSPELSLELTDAQAPGVMRGSSNPNDVYLLMPIRQ